jgi:hypothetical protein
MSDDEILAIAVGTMIDRGHISVDALATRIGPAIRRLHLDACELTAQKNALLAACKRYIYAGTKDDGWYAETMAAITDMRAAIALCQPQPEPTNEPA